MKKAFTLVEILIVTAILGIMAAIVMPLFAGHVQLAKEAAAKDNLRILRGAIERYAAEHNDIPPGSTNLGFMRKLTDKLNPYLSHHLRIEILPS